VSYREFEDVLKSVRGYGGVEVFLDGIMRNLFYRGVREVDRYSLDTLRIRYPEIYETVRDEKVREALVLAEMFTVNPFKGSGVEIVINEEDRYLRDFIDGWHLWITLCKPYVGRARYVGGDAVKIFLKSTFLLSKTLHEILDFPVLYDPWRCKQGMENIRDEVKNAVNTYVREIVREALLEMPDIPPYHKPEEASAGIAYTLWYYYHFRSGVWGKVGKILKINLRW